MDCVPRVWLLFQSQDFDSAVTMLNGLIFVQSEVLSIPYFVQREDLGTDRPY